MLSIHNVQQRIEGVVCEEVREQMGVLVVRPSSIKGFLALKKFNAFMIFPIILSFQLF